MTTQTRRQAISSAAKFVIPTVTAFALSEVQVAASGYTHPKLNNGHHYGNDMPDTHKVK